jgi:hypothetical protein
MLDLAVVSITTCRLDHSFPWKYHQAVFDEGGHLVCPSCGTELECVWRFQRLYGPATF